MMARRAPTTRLVADLGGTNARVELAIDGFIPPHDVPEVTVRSAAEALALFRSRMQQSGAGGLTEAAIAAAGPIDGDTVTLTNGGWSFSATAMKQS
jgi:glucokinase